MNAVVSRLVAALCHPFTIDDYVALASPLWSSGEVRARVVEVRRETHDVATLVLRPNARWRGHRAGQHVALTVEVRGVRRTRFFSVASGEVAEDGNIELTVKGRPGGEVTPSLISGALGGAIVTLSQATGSFVLPDIMPERTLLLSGGSGITPVMSMLRTLARAGARDEVTFVTWARSEADVIYREELTRLAREAGPKARVFVRIGPFDAATLAEIVADFETWDTWACGPAPFLEAVGAAFEARDPAAGERLRTERFSLERGADTSGENEVTFTRSDMRARGGGSLLGLAERSGLTPATGCRMGICRTCTCRKISGTTRDLRTGALSTDSDVDVQLCVSEPVGPVALDL
jgi:ferredoxin-NADP reductase